MYTYCKQALCQIKRCKHTAAEQRRFLQPWWLVSREVPISGQAGPRFYSIATTLPAPRSPGSLLGMVIVKTCAQSGIWRERSWFLPPESCAAAAQGPAKGHTPVPAPALLTWLTSQSNPQYHA